LEALGGLGARQARPVIVSAPHSGPWMRRMTGDRGVWRRGKSVNESPTTTIRARTDTKGCVSASGRAEMWKCCPRVWVVDGRVS
jgi:hypothetical protein